jgi:hypothetical protein
LRVEVGKPNNWNRRSIVQRRDVVRRDRRRIADADKEYGEGMLVYVQEGCERGEISIVLHSNVATLRFGLCLECIYPVLIARKWASIGRLSTLVTDA